MSWLVITAILHTISVQFNTCFAVASADKQECDADDKKCTNPTPTDKSNNEKCRIYLAESSIPNAGLGVYSSVDIPKGWKIGNDDMTLLVTDFPANHQLLGDYWWIATEIGAQFTADSVAVLAPGLGMACNCYFGLNNAHSRVAPKTKNSVMDRFGNVGAGSVSESPMISWIAKERIPKGMEILVDYGKGWFTSRAYYLGYIPLPDSFAQGEKIIRGFLPIQSKNDAADRELWEIIRNATDPHVQSALPENLQNLDRAVSVGLSNFSLPNVVRSPEWLEEHGLCMDNIRVDVSTLEDAGRGAFATRFLLKGSLVSPAPLVHLDEGTFDFYSASNGMVGKQLLLNYCFGHYETSVLFFPYSSTVGFINHNRTQANAEIRWSTSPHHHAEWLNKSVEEIVQEHRSGLLFDIVATRDIKAGEEVLIDYGEKWEQAWNEHKRNWKPPSGSDRYATPKSMNSDAATLKTMAEQEKDPYPENLQTACMFHYDRKSTQKYEEQASGDESIIISYKNFPQMHKYYHLRPCEILSRDDNLYKVRLLDHKSVHDEDKLPVDKMVIVEHMPRNMISFVEKPYFGNIHLANAFRHPIGIPDDMIPNRWKNKEA